MEIGKFRQFKHKDQHLSPPDLVWKEYGWSAIKNIKINVFKMY